MKSASYKKLTFRLAVDAEGYPPVGFESLWGIETGSEQYALDNAPYYVNGVSKRDVVSVINEGGELFAYSVLKRGGHSTLRVFAESRERRLRVIESIEKLGGVCHVQNGLSLFVVDISPEVSFRSIDEYLESVSDGETLAYEDACLQHLGVSDARREECSSIATIPFCLN